MNQVCRLTILFILLGTSIPATYSWAWEIDSMMTQEEGSKSERPMALPEMAAKSQAYQNIWYDTMFDSTRPYYDSSHSEGLISNKRINITEIRSWGDENHMNLIYWATPEEGNGAEIIDTSYVIGLKFSYKKFHLKELYRSFVSLIRSKRSSSADEPTVSIYFDLP